MVESGVVVRQKEGMEKPFIGFPGEIAIRFNRKSLSIRRISTEKEDRHKRSR